MRKNYIYISLFIVSIIGLSMVQYQYFRIGLNLAGLQFDENIGEAISGIKEGMSTNNELTYLVSTVIQKDETNFRLSMDSLQDASAHFLKDYLVAELAAEGIRADFDYALRIRDSVVLLGPEAFFDDEKELLVFPMTLEGYLSESVSAPVILELRFENLNRYFLSQLNGLTIPSMIFILVIVFILIWVFRAFYMQRNLITTTNEFINNLTHELKTPVFSMGLATKILEERASDDQKQVLGMMRTQIDKLKSQIDKVLELAIIEGKKEVLRKKHFDFKPVLEKLAEDFKKIVEMEGGSFAYEFKGRDYPVSGDQYHLENAMNSLLENARKYSGQNIKIIFLGAQKGRNLILKIADEGIGMPEEVQKRIFDKYYRGSGGDLHEVKGYGLGLHYVQRIVRMHKGKIKVESTEGEGSVFIVNLPLDMSQ